MKAKLFADSEECSENEKIAQLDSEVVTLTCTKVESSIVASTCWDREAEITGEIQSSLNDDVIPLFIPADLKLKVALLRK